MSAPHDLAAMEARFHKLVSFLHGFGFRGEVLLKAGLAIVGARDKHSASMIRRAFKQARNVGAGTLTEVRGKNGACAFVWVDDSLAMTRQEIREIALAA